MSTVLPKAVGLGMPLLGVVLACSRATLSGDDVDTGGGQATSSGAGSSGGGASSSGGGSSSSTSNSSNGSGGDDGGGAFLQEPDGAGTDIECDIWSQDCPDGLKCMPWANDGGSSWNATTCAPIHPDRKQTGEPCWVEDSDVSGIDNCDLGSMCWDVDPETLEGYCVAFCTGTAAEPSCPDPGDDCTISAESVLPLCLPMCDPIVQDCRPGTVCVPGGSRYGFICVLDASGEEGQAGAPCYYTNVCDPGLFCCSADRVPGCTGSIGCCTEFCDLRLPDPSSMCSMTDQGAECVPYFEAGAEPPGLEHVGGCLLPA